MRSATPDVLMSPGSDSRGNPYVTLLHEHLAALGVRTVQATRRRALSGRYGLWHVQWPEAVLKPGREPLVLMRTLRWLAVVTLARLRGVRIVWTVHNLAHHEQRPGPASTLFWRLFPRLVSGVVSLTEAGVPLAVEAHPTLRGRPLVVAAHGDYRQAYPPAPARDAARAALGLPSGARVYLYLGTIRPYKDVPALIRAFRALPDPQAVLVVAGRPGARAWGAAVEAAAAGDQRIRLDLAHIPPDRVATYLGAADLVVLPFREVFNSGSAMLALSFDRPVLLPDSPTTAELERRVGGPWVNRYPHTLGPAELAGAMAAAGQTHGQAPLDAFSWSESARRIAQLYRMLA